MTEPESHKIATEGLSAWFGDNAVLRDVSLQVPDRQVTSIIGPSGCGKSTLVRCFNRMHELVADARMQGDVLLDGRNVYGSGVDPSTVRRRVGMVFQEPNPFPTMSIRDNVLAGLVLTRSRPPDEDQVVEEALGAAALWDEVKDRLDEPGVALSGGQQQRLCIARALAVRPEVLLMDEPCSALDPIATTRIEDLLHGLREHYAIVLVTHNLRQAARVSQRTAFLLQGELIEVTDTDAMFTSPRDSRTEDYITGKFG